MYNQSRPNFGAGSAAPSFGFGAANPTSAASPFGQSFNKPATTGFGATGFGQQATSPFGGGAATTTQPGGGLFNAGTSTAFGQPAPQQTAFGSAFGAAAQPQQQQQQQQTSLFGSTPAQQSTLFGSTTAGAFGATAAKPGEF